MKKRSTLFKIFFLVLLPASLLIMGLGVSSIITSSREYLPVTATVTAVEKGEFDTDGYGTSFYYFVDGEKYEAWFYYDVLYNVGDEITVYCEKGKPTSIMSSEPKIAFGIIVLSLGAVFCAAALVAYFSGK